MAVYFHETPPEVQEILARRRETGLAKRDEVWDGVYHALPPRHSRNARVAVALVAVLDERAAAAGLEAVGSATIGEPDDVRVPDLVLLRPGASELYLPTAALVVELRFPHDEVMQKLGFSAAHGVGELWVVDPLERSVRIWQLATPVADAPEGTSREYTETGRSDLLDLDAETVERDLRWPDG